MSPSAIFSITAGGNDGSVQASDTVYPPAATPTFTSTGAFDYLTKMLNAGTYQVYCELLKFDTSSLPDNAIINSASLEFSVSFRFADTAELSRNIVGEFYAWTGVAGDWTATVGTDAISGYPFNSLVPANNVNSLSRNSIPLTGFSGISTTGNTSLRLGISGGTPTGLCYAEFQTFNNVVSAPAPALIVDYTVPDQETLRPTSVQLTSLTGAATDIDDDPENPDSLWLTGTDPSAVAGQTNGPEYPNARTGATGQTAFTWDANIANVTDTSDSTLSIETSATTTKGDYFTIPAAAFTDLPADASITGFSVAFKHRAGTANRVTVLAQLGTANGTLIGAEQTVISTLATTAGGVTHTVSSWGATPTRANLVSGTFGIRLRITRSQAATYEFYSMKATATYTGGALTTNTEARVAMGDPTGTLATGAATGEVRLQARKLGSGTSPQARVEVYETTDLNTLGSVLATPIADTTVSAADPGTVLSGTFDQSSISNKNNVVLRVLGTGALGGLVEVGALEWNANTQTVPPEPAVRFTQQPLTFY